MADSEKKDLNIDSLEVRELEDQDLDDVAGGAEPVNGTCPTTNTVAGCGAPLPGTTSPFLINPGFGGITER